LLKEVFGNKNFSKLFFSNLFSGFGQGMTTIGISWYLVETTGTARLLGSTMLITAILGFLIGPYAGTWIDRFSRKAILQIEQLGGFTVLAVFAGWGFWGPYHVWMMIFIFLAVSFIFQIHDATQAAFVQEIFDQKQYKAILSLLEIENQTAMVLSGMFAGLLLEKVGLQVVLLFDTLTYLFAFVVVSSMDYCFTLEKQTEKTVDLFSKGWVYIKERKGLMVFGVSALIPFIVVMLVNLLSPIFVSQTLGEDVDIYSLAKVAYSIGAVAAGLLVAFISRKFVAFSSMVSHYVLMAIVLVLIVVIPKGWYFILQSALLGWCNVTTRLIQRTIYMELLENCQIGRVMSFFKSIGQLIRLLLLTIFTLMIDATGAKAGYLILAGLLLIATLGIIFSMRVLTRQTS
jgi:MFS family permease